MTSEQILRMLMDVVKEVCVIYQPRRERLAWAIRGEGCWLQIQDQAPSRVWLSGIV